MDLKLETKCENGYTLCEVTGEIDLYNAKQLKEKVGDMLEEADDAGKSGNLILDIRNVKYIDSTGLGILIGIKRRITEKSCGIVLVLSEERILQLFTITGLINIFTIADSIEEAAAKL